MKHNDPNLLNLLKLVNKFSDLLIAVVKNLSKQEIISLSQLKAKLPAELRSKLVNIKKEHRYTKEVKSKSR